MALLTTIETERWIIKLFDDGSRFIRPRPDIYGILVTGTEAKEFSAMLDACANIAHVDREVAAYYLTLMDVADDTRFVRPLN